MLSNQRGQIITWRFTKEANELISERPIMQIIGARTEFFIRLLAGKMVLFYKRQGSIYRIGSFKPHLNLVARLKCKNKNMVRISIMNGSTVFASIKLEKKLPFAMIKISNNADLVSHLEISEL